MFLGGDGAASASLPSPLVGEGAEPRSGEAGEGLVAAPSKNGSDPSPGVSRCLSSGRASRGPVGSPPPSATRGEGVTARDDDGACASSRSHRYCATLVS